MTVRPSVGIVDAHASVLADIAGFWVFMKTKCHPMHDQGPYIEEMCGALCFPFAFRTYPIDEHNVGV